jgi:hypothetical protein
VRNVLKWIVVVLVVIFGGMQFVRPTRTNPPVNEAQTIFTKTQMPPAGAAIFNRACADCHSDKTEWPWYSNVAPVSWFVAGHVNDGRKAMNLSEWGQQDQDWQSRKLRQICDEITDGGMPLSSYTPMHPHSKLSPDDVKALCDWTKGERDRMAGAAK